jgi:hypothetical protein
LQANKKKREDIQADGRMHFFIAGLTFWPPKEALKAHFLENGTECVNFGLAKPDLLEIILGYDGYITWKVIEVKRHQMLLRYVEYLNVSSSELMRSSRPRIMSKYIFTPFVLPTSSQNPTFFQVEQQRSGGLPQRVLPHPHLPSMT